MANRKRTVTDAIHPCSLFARGFRFRVSNLELYIGFSISDLMLYTVASPSSTTYVVPVARPICRLFSSAPSLLLAITELGNTSLGVQVVVPGAVVSIARSAA